MRRTESSLGDVPSGAILLALVVSGCSQTGGPGGSCTPGQQEACGNCGTRTCDGSSSFGPCLDEGACSPGAVSPCGTSGSMSCTGACQWGDCAGPCEAGESAPCGNCGTISCAATGTWGACADGPCQLGEKSACSACSARTCIETAASGQAAPCEWSACQSTCDPGQECVSGVCTPCGVLDAPCCGDTCDEPLTCSSSTTCVDPPFDPAGTLRITSPSDFQVIQRDLTSHATIPIAGTFAGTPRPIEARWNGSAWTTIAASPANGVFSGQLPNQAAGQGKLEVRFMGTAISDSKSPVGIGDILVITGGSNGSGRGDNPQVYSHPTLKASIFANDYKWKNMVDPIDRSLPKDDDVSRDTGAKGSVWPLVATKLMANQNVPVAFIPTAKGASSIEEWQVSGPLTSGLNLYGAMAKRIKAAGGKVKIVLMQGAFGVKDLTEAQFKKYSTAFASAVYGLTGAKVAVSQVGDIPSSYTPAQMNSVNNIRTAQRELWEAGGTITRGATSYDINLGDGDGLHYKTNAELATFANRWWAPLRSTYYGGTDGEGPRISSSSLDGTGRVVTLTFTDASLPLTPATGITGLTAHDSNGAVPVLSAYRSGSAVVKLNLGRKAAANLRVSCGAARTSLGPKVVKDNTGYHLPADVFIDFPVPSP